MISAELVGAISAVIAALSMFYAIRNLASESTTLEQASIDKRDARLAASAMLLCVVVAAGAFGYAEFADTTPQPVPPVPGPPDPLPPGPQPPTPNPPAPSDFAGRIQAAFKADSGTPGLARVLGAMARRLSEEIVAKPASFKDARDIGAKWEEYRGTIFQPMGRWCPKTNELLAAERESRQQTSGTITDHAAHAKLWDEFGKALLAYE